MTNSAEPLAITVRLEPDVAERLRAHRERLLQQAPSGGDISLAHTIRNLVLRGLSEAERPRK